MKHHLTDILEKFEEGQNLYNTSALFNKCVHYLANGGNIYHILETVIKMNDEQIKVTQDILEKSNVPIMFKSMTKKIKESRIVYQDWYGTEDSKTGWSNNVGWYFKEGDFIDPSWTITEIIQMDKYGNPIQALVERECYGKVATAEEEKYLETIVARYGDIHTLMEVQKQKRERSESLIDYYKKEKLRAQEEFWRS